MFTVEELDALNRMIQTVHKAEKAIEILADVTLAPSSKMDVLKLESRIGEEYRKLVEANKKEAAQKTE